MELSIKSVNQFAENFIKTYQEIKKLYAFEVSIISFMEAAKFVCLRRHSLLIIYAKMKQIRFEKYFLFIFMNMSNITIKDLLYKKCCD